jgi:hypothetical protein
MCVLAAIGVVAFWPGEREPEYNGKKLSEWLMVAASQGWDEPDSPETMEALAAVRSIGTNALPCLVKWIQFEQPKWRKDILGAYRKFPQALYRDSNALWLLGHDERCRRVAPLGFAILSTNAAASVPELVRVVRTSQSADARDAAIWATAHIGKDGFPVLLAALEDRKTSDKAAVCISQMSQAGSDISRAIPGLLLLDHQTHKLAAQYPGFAHVYWIPRVDQNFRDMIPSLANCLHHTNSDVRAEAAYALGMLGDRSLPMVPALRGVIDDRVIAVQKAAVEALEKIAPEVLTNGVTHF